MEFCRMSNNSHAQQLDVVRRAVETLPEGIVKRHMSAAVQSLHETLHTLQASHAPEQASAAVVVAAPDGFPSRLASRLSAYDLPGTPSPHQALMIAVHSLLLDSGLTCIGSTDAADNTGFARPIRAITSFLPRDWSTQGGTLFHFWYSYPPPGTTSSLSTLLLAGMAVGPVLSLSVRMSGTAGAGSSRQTSASTELDTGKYCAHSSAAADLPSFLSPLLSEDLLASLRSILRSQIVYPLVPQLDPSATDKNSSSSSSGTRGMEQERGASMPSYQSRGPEHGQGGGGLAAGLRQPRTGVPGDFDRDLGPDMSGSVPGGLLGAGHGGRGGMGAGGMTVGPGHPLFGHPGGMGGMGGGMGGGGFGMPFGAPPGARFDPFGPPGTGIGIPGGPRGPGLGGPRGPPGFGPAPDHLRPPTGNGGPDDMGPPPDIYW